MNGKQRMQAAMSLSRPDRVPVMCQLSIGHYFLNSNHSPIDIWFRSESLVDAMVQLQRRYQFDGILVNLPGRDPEFEKAIERIETGKGESIIHWNNGNFTKVPHDDNPHYFQGDGTRYFPTFEEVDPETLWYVEPWDLTDITYPFTWGFEQEPRPSDRFFPDYHFDPLSKVIQEAGETVSIHSEIFSPFSQFLELLNYENALMALLDDPSRCHAMLERLTMGTTDLGIRQAKCGVDAILISSAFAGGGLISCEHYEEFVLPYEKRSIDGIRKQFPDLPIYTHTCGAIGDRLDLMLKTGTSGIDTLDPPPLGTVELDEAVQTLRGKVFIKGNIDPVNTLLYGNPDKVKAAVRERFEIAKPAAAYILSSACSVAPAVKPELIALLSELADTEGRY